MSIDLTKGIVVRPILEPYYPIKNFDTKRIEVRAFCFGPVAPSGWWVNEGPQEGLPEAEAYRRLFEAAPKMLATLKEIARDGWCECSIFDCENSSHQVAVLIAEIEAGMSI